MRIFIKLALIYILFLPIVNARTITLGTHDLFPYGSYSGDQFTGIAVDLVKCAFSKLPEKLRVKVVPWARAQAMTVAGEYDGFFAASQNQSRDSFARRSAQVADQKWIWFYKSDYKFNEDRIKSTCRNNCSNTSSFLGANMHHWLERNNYKTVYPPVTTQKLVLAVMRGEVDVGLANNYVLKDILNRYRYASKIKQRLLKSKPLYVYFNNKFVKADPTFVGRFNRALLSCKR